MSFDLLIKNPFKDYSLNNFLSDLLALIRCEQWEHKQNGTTENFHFLLTVMGVRIIVSDVNDARLAEYRFGIRFEPEIMPKEEGLSFDGLADCLARKLAADGFDAVRPLQREIAHGGIHYLKNPDKSSSQWKPVLMEVVDAEPSPQYALRFLQGDP